MLPSFVCCVFAVHDFQFADTAGDARWSGRGEGSYGTNEIGEISQSMSLDLTIGEFEHVQLTSGNVAIVMPFPAIEISLTEDGERDPNRRFSMRVLAAPKANETVL